MTSKSTHESLIVDSAVIQRKYMKWSKEEENTLKFLYEDRKLCIYKISNVIKRTPCSVVSKLRNLKITDHYYNARGFNKILKFYKSRERNKLLNKVKLDKKNSKIQKK
jgi:hypothetical protein